MEMQLIKHIAASHAKSFNLDPSRHHLIILGHELRILFLSHSPILVNQLSTPLRSRLQLERERLGLHDQQRGILLLERVAGVAGRLGQRAAPGDGAASRDELRVDKFLALADAPAVTELVVVQERGVLRQRLLVGGELGVQPALGQVGLGVGVDRLVA